MSEADMSEADRVFSGRRGQRAQAPSGERRHIVSAPRKRGAEGSKSRVVEVVHVRREGAQPRSGQPRPAAWSVRAETWSEGFRAKPAQPLPQQDIQPVAPEPASPVVHVMPMWEPSAPQPEPPLVEPDEPSVEPVMTERRRSRIPKARTSEGTARRFADPFADADEGANCLRCGYLVE